MTQFFHKVILAYGGEQWQKNIPFPLLHPLPFSLSLSPPPTDIPMYIVVNGCVKPQVIGNSLWFYNRKNMSHIVIPFLGYLTYNCMVVGWIYCT